MYPVIRRNLLVWLFAAAGMCLSALPAAATGSLLQETSQVVRLRAEWSVDRARPADSILLAVVATVAKGFHINADEAQVTTLQDFKPFPTRLVVTETSAGVKTESPRYPRARVVTVDYATGSLMSFEGETVIILPVQLTEQVQPGMIALKLSLEYQACATDYCMFPQKAAVEAELPVVDKSQSVRSINVSLFAGHSRSGEAAAPEDVTLDLFGWGFRIDLSRKFGWVLLLTAAALGGFLLNLTPCVLPIIPIKIINLCHTAENRRRCVGLGLAMFCGILVFWLGLGAAIALVSDFTVTNQLFNYPAFTLTVGAIIAAMALGMFGFFAVRLPNFIYRLNPAQDSLPGNFGIGILTAVLSTPCTAPFMGAAAAWAATRPPLTTLSTFAAIGTGMALPYLVLSAAPGLVKRMPKSGPAGELIKEVMGLFMLAAASYFIGVGLSALLTTYPGPASRLYWWPVMGFCAAAAGWLVYRILRINTAKVVKALWTAVGVLLVGLSTYGAWHLTASDPVKWVYYTPQAFDDAMARHRVIVLVFTAEWCLNCRVLEQSVLQQPSIAELLANEAVVPMRVDLTGDNPAGKAKLNDVGKLTIPLLVVYSSDGRELLKSDFYSLNQVRQAILHAMQGG
jgi:thiol:disulfide interchange protein